MWPIRSVVANVSLASLRAMHRRTFHNGTSLLAVKPYLLADIGEGIREVQIIQWFVKPGARVEQFQALCEVQSDKATVEITSRFDGIVKKLHYEADDMAQVGKALCDIDIQSEISEEDAAVTGDTESKEITLPSSADIGLPSAKSKASEAADADHRWASGTDTSTSSAKHERHRTLSTPAVRHMCNDLKVNITDVPGTGKDGRVLKEDVQRFAAEHSDSIQVARSSQTSHQPALAAEHTVALTPVQTQMFKTMSRSLSIPHFLYTDTIDLTALTRLRTHLNNDIATKDDAAAKLSALAFILKATSLALKDYPLLNARIDTSRGPDKPQLVMRPAHHLGFACDTPAGLLVPVVRDVDKLSVREIAAEIARLAALGRAGKLASADLAGGTFTVSNVGSIGGGVVAPLIVDSQVAIVGVGRARTVPAFGDDGEIVRREECVLSWSADHRIVDGATVARCAELVRTMLEEPAGMLVRLR